MASIDSGVGPDPGEAGLAHGAGERRRSRRGTRSPGGRRRRPRSSPRPGRSRSRDTSSEACRPRAKRPCLSAHVERARSASEYTPTVSIPISRAVRATRTAISPRLAISRRRIMAAFYVGRPMRYAPGPSRIPRRSPTCRRRRHPGRPAQADLPQLREGVHRVAARHGARREGQVLLLQDGSRGRGRPPQGPAGARRRAAPPPAATPAPAPPRTLRRLLDRPTTAAASPGKRVSPSRPPSEARRSAIVRTVSAIASSGFRPATCSMSLLATPTASGPEVSSDATFSSPAAAQLRRRHDGVHEADAVRLFRVESVARQEEVSGCARPDGAQDVRRDDGRQDAELDLGQGEDGRLRRDRDVRRGNEADAAADRRPVRRGPRRASGSRRSIGTFGPSSRASASFSSRE